NEPPPRMPSIWNWPSMVTPMRREADELSGRLAIVGTSASTAVAFGSAGCALLGAVVARAMAPRLTSARAAPQAGQNRPVSSVVVEQAVQALTEVERSRLVDVHAQACGPDVSRARRAVRLARMGGRAYPQGAGASASGSVGSPPSPPGSPP